MTKKAPIYKAFYHCKWCDEMLEEIKKVQLGILNPVLQDVNTGLFLKTTHHCAGDEKRFGIAELVGYSPVT